MKYRTKFMSLKRAVKFREVMKSLRYDAVIRSPSIGVYWVIWEKK